MQQFPFYITLGSHQILWHSILEALAIFIGFRYYLYLKNKQGDTLPAEHRGLIIVAATFGAVLGARILGTAENLPQFAESLHKFQFFWGNKTILGGLFGGLIAVDSFKYFLKQKKSSGDLFLFPLILAMMIGRLGCFSAGLAEETYGLASNLPWAINLGDGIPRHPVTLYEILFLLLTWTGIVALQKKYLLADGAAFKIFMLAYFIFRFCLDFIKPGWHYFIGLGSIQIACLLGFVYYYKTILNPRTLILNKK